MTLLTVILLAAILVVLGGILLATKKGFNEVIISGLESIDERLSRPSDTS